MVRRKTHSGGFVANDCVMHFVDSALPFGGVGPSGMGAYHGGQVGFNTFSHRKSCLIRGAGLEKVNDLRVPVCISSKN
jgi:acyl-CoA reductase-like NAD-dependent aldehyde dehydrogenase